MSDYSIPVDLWNPGQVFACLGLMEAALQLEQPVLARFEWTERAEFILSAKQDPFSLVLGFLRVANIRALHEDPGKWSVQWTRAPPGAPSPLPPQSSPSTAAAVLEANDGRDRVDVTHWGDGTMRDEVKFWGGSGGMPGAEFLVRMLEAARTVEDWRADPMGVSVPLSSSFRFDPRGSYVPIDSGFSLNNHSRINMAGFPLVEVLAAIGLSHARPLRVRPLHYRYSVVRASRGLPPAFLRASLGCAELPFDQRIFSMRLARPDKGRSITSVSEYTP